jgi:hypothetical protein
MDTMTPDPKHAPRRFSEGQEALPHRASSARVGRFADGMTGPLADSAAAVRVGTFADGLLLRPDSPPARRIGGFADRFVPPIVPAPPRRRPPFGGAGPHPQHA